MSEVDRGHGGALSIGTTRDRAAPESVRLVEHRDVEGALINLIVDSRASRRLTSEPIDETSRSIRENPGGELDISRSDVLPQTLPLRRCRDRDDPGLLGDYHARAICAGVGCFRSPIVRNRSTKVWFALRACGVNRGQDE